MGIPYTGAGYLGSGLAMDKDLTKRLIAHLGVHTPQWQRVSYTEQEVEDLAAATQVPCVVKPVASGSSIGVSIAHTRQELHGALMEGCLLYTSTTMCWPRSSALAARMTL